MKGGRLDATREISLRLLPFGPDRVGEVTARASLPVTGIDFQRASCKFFVARPEAFAVSQEAAARHAVVAQG